MVPVWCGIWTWEYWAGDWLLLNDEAGGGAEVMTTEPRRHLAKLECFSHTQAFHKSAGDAVHVWELECYDLRAHWIYKKHIPNKLQKSDINVFHHNINIWHWTDVSVVTALIAFAEDPSSIPNTPMTAHKSVIPFRGSNAVSWPSTGTPWTRCTGIHANKTLIRLNEWLKVQHEFWEEGGRDIDIVLVSKILKKTLLNKN